MRNRNEFNGWHKSSYSGSGENCVFKGIQQDSTGAVTAVGVFDSKQGSGDGSVIAVSPAAWAAFVNDVASV